MELAHIVRFPNGAEALKGLDGVQVNAGIRSCRREGRLIDVGFSLQMQPRRATINLRSK